MSLSAPLLVLLLLLLAPHPAAAGFTLSLPAGSAVTTEAPSRLVFTVGNADASEGVSQLTLRFPSGYRVLGGSAPPGWAVGVIQEGAEISFRTEDEVTCRGAIPKGGALVFGVEVIAPASRVVTPDRLVGADAEQPCRGVTLSPPPTLPSWERLGVEVQLIAGPPLVGVGGDITVSMTVTNLSTVELADIAPLLGSNGTGGVAALTGPMPGSLTLAPGAPGTMSWRARAASAGTLIFSGQAVARDLVSPPAGSDTLVIGDLEVSLSVTPEQVVGGQEVWAEMTVTNRGPVRVANVTPSPLAFEGTATASAPAGPSPASAPVLEPGESTAFAWAATISGGPGETYAFSGWASAEWDRIVSASAISNRGALAQESIASEPVKAVEGSVAGGGGVPAGEAGAAVASATSAAAAEAGAAVASATSAAAAGGSTSLPTSASVQFVAVNHNGSQTAGTQFATALVRNLRIPVAWQNLSGSHTQRLDFFSPDGSLYQRVSAQFSGASSVETRLLVGGTWITEYSLFGAWRVEVYLDGQDMPIASGVFVLDP